MQFLGLYKVTDSKVKERISKSKLTRGKRYIRVLIIFIVLALISVAAGLYLSITMFTSYAKKYREDTLKKAAVPAASEINPYKMDDWIENGPDEEFEDTKGHLQLILDNTPFLQNIYLVRVDKEGFHTLCVLTTNDQEVRKHARMHTSDIEFGEVFPFDPSFGKTNSALLVGGDVDIVEIKNDDGWTLIAYEPIYTHLNECKGYVGVEVSLNGINGYINTFTVWVSIISIIFLCLIGLVGIIITSYARRADDLDVIAEQKERDQKLLQELIESYAQVVDAKDPYTNGHSSRVAEYAVKIAELVGKNDEECQQIYFTALLHDVGKVGIPDAIINKPGKLTEEEFNIIKQHPEKGNRILSQIDEFSYLSVGAHFHHERYDGKGYPNGLKGKEIPEIARIIACADAYDAMTSRRSYRDPIPQHIVREEFVKGIGTQFDPEFARTMLHLIDLDAEYAMKDRGENKEIRDNNQLLLTYHRSAVTPGILLSNSLTTVKVTVNPDSPASRNKPKPSIVLFVSLDGHLHELEKDKKEMLDFEYGEIWFGGRHSVAGARKMESTTEEGYNASKGKYTIEAARIKDHAIVRIKGSNGKEFETIVALPDSSRFVYLGLTGEHCLITDIDITKSEDELPESYIPRIAEKISYIDGRPEGDIPNVEMDGYRTDSTKGILLKDNLTISFHTMSLPTARLVWHCPFISIFSSGDGTIGGKDFRELTLMRLDGECWEGDPACSMELKVTKTSDFEDWTAWKEYNHTGYDVTVNIVRDGNKIHTTTTNGGISVHATTVMSAEIDPIYIALTGDQCAITNIRIRNT